VPVLLLATEALEVSGPVLVVIEPGRNQRDVAHARIHGNVGDVRGVLGEGAAGTVLFMKVRSFEPEGDDMDKAMNEFMVISTAKSCAW